MTMKSTTRSASSPSWTAQDIIQGILGPEEDPREPDSYLRARLEQLARLERGAVDRCLEPLLAMARDGSEAPDALEALVLLGLAQPKVCQREGLAVVNYARRAAALYERLERESRARALLELVAERIPGHRALERDLAAILRRAGEMEALVERHLAHAQQHIDAGAPQEAIPWLQEVLLVDPSRKDVARLIRDLRFEEGERHSRRRRVKRVALVVVLFSMLATGLYLREQKVGESFAALPATGSGELASMESRLEQLERFISRYPIWHGALGVLEERGRLRSQIEAMRARAESEREREGQLAARRHLQAEAALAAGRAAAESRDWRAALNHFETALDNGAPNWSERPWVERNIAALRGVLAEGR